MTHICVVKLTIIGSDNGLSPGRRQAIIWTNAGILLIGPLGTNFSDILIGIQTFSFKKMHLTMSSAKWRPFCLGLNVLNNIVEPPLLCWEWLCLNHYNRVSVLLAKWQIFSKPFDIDRDISWYVLVFCEVNLWSDRHWAVVFYLVVFNWLWHSPGAL